MIYLASKSERRKELLRKAKIPFKIISSSYEENNKTKISPPDLVMMHAYGKAANTKAPKKNLWILGSDTIVVYKNKVLGKPKSKNEAKKMMRMLAGRTHRVYTGVCLLNPKKELGVLDFEVTKVTMKRLSEKQIREYYEVVNPMDKAGSYAIQEGPKIVTRINGSYSNVVGLPMELLKRMMKRIKKVK